MNRKLSSYVVYEKPLPEVEHLLLELVQYGFGGGALLMADLAL